MEQIKGLITLVQEAIDNGATTVEEVHRTIAAKPLEILKNVGPLANAAEKISDFQEQSIGSVYDTIRMINTQVGDIAKDLLDKMEK